jgi:hypothetical protein
MVFYQIIEKYSFYALFRCRNFLVFAAETLAIGVALPAFGRWK